MLNKDQYNQDEYNDYYAQEIRGAEIAGGKDESGGGKKIAFIFLLLLLIIALAYFGWKSMKSGSNTDSSSPADIESNIELDKSLNRDSTTITTDREKESESKNADKISTSSSEEAIAKEVQKITSKDSSGKMSPEDIANIVQMVMKKMNSERAKATSSTSGNTKTANGSNEQLQDKKLLDSLSALEVDSLSDIADDVTKLSEADKTRKASSSDTPNTYNKVVLKNESNGGSSDELSKLSNEISNVINTEESATIPKDSSYAKSLTKEVKTRKKEMRYVTVRKGDTLAKIAKRVYGNSMAYKKIYRANPDILKRPDKIYIGQRLRVPE